MSTVLNEYMMMMMLMTDRCHRNEQFVTNTRTETKKNRTRQVADQLHHIDDKLQQWLPKHERKL